MPRYYNNDEFYRPPNGYYGSEREVCDRAYFANNIKKMVEKNRDYQKWRIRTRKFLLISVASRLAALGMYAAHTMDEEFASLIHHLNLTFQFSASNVFQHNQIMCLIDAIPTRVAWLIKELRDAEEIQTWSRTHPREDHALFCEWQTKRLAVRAKKTRLRDQRLRRALAKQQRQLTTKRSVL